MLRNNFFTCSLCISMLIWNVRRGGHFMQGNTRFKSSRYISHLPWCQQRVSYVHISVHDNTNACQYWHIYWRDIVIVNKSLYIFSHVHDTIDICRGKNDIGNDNFLPHMMAWKTMPRTNISQNLISKMNMLFPTTSSGPTWRQPNQQLQLQFHKIQCPRFIPHKMQCPRHFFIGFKCHQRQRRIPHESGIPGTANPSFAYRELTCPPGVHIWGPWKTMFHVMSHEKRAQIQHVFSLFLTFLARQL